MSTNPFTAAAASGQDSASQNREDSIEKNPFKSHSRSTSGANGIPASSSNPFQSMDAYSQPQTQATQHPHLQQQQQSQSPSQIPAANNDIASQLAGLDFGGGVPTSSAAAPAAQQYSLPQHQSERQASALASQPADHAAVSQGVSYGQSTDLGTTSMPSSSSPGPIEGQTAMPQAQSPSADPFASTPHEGPIHPAGRQFSRSAGGNLEAAQGTFAPPSGPPPGHEASATSASADQIVADEAFARQLLASEQRSGSQSRDEGRDSRGGGYNAGSAFRGDAARSTSQSRQQQSSQQPINGSYAAASTQPAGTHQSTNEETQWNTKEIYWRGRSQRIVLQNENGPCSLIALCNVLFLRGTLAITPEDRPAVSYSYLSSLLAEHLLDVIRDDSALDLEAALSILPQTQTGLDVNVRFNAIDGFAVEEKAPSSNEPAAASSSAAAAALPHKTDAETQRGELALFKLCNVPLVHGWLADKDDKATYAAVVERAGDYDRALDRVVAGDELAKGTIVGGSASGFGAENMTAEQSSIVNDAVLIRNFLESTATQLTYPGLYALSTTLERGVPYALFRNSHLSVIYRPMEQEIAPGAEHDSSPPALFQLVTDAMLETEDNVVWESLEDIDGSASRFFDAKFRGAKVTQDFVGRRNEQQQQQQGYEDGDMALAHQLQEEERDRVRRHQAARDARRQQHQRASASGSGGASGGGGNVISRMLAARKTNKRTSGAQVQLHNDVAHAMGGQPTSTGSSSRQRQQQQPDPQLTPAQTEAQAAQAQMRADMGDSSTAGEQKKSKWWKKF